MYKLNTNKYVNLSDKLTYMFKIKLSNELQDVLKESYEVVLEKRNKYAHASIEKNLNEIGVEGEISSFLTLSCEWLTNISEKIIEKCNESSS